MAAKAVGVYCPKLGARALRYLANDAFLNSLDRKEHGILEEAMPAKEKKARVYKSRFTDRQIAIACGVLDAEDSM